MAVEEPLEVRLNGAPFAVIMRTPGADQDLALGFAFSEGLVARRADVERIDCDPSGDIVNIVFARGRGDAIAEALAGRRQVTMNSSCGLCGRRTLASLVAELVRLYRWNGRSIAVRLPAFPQGSATRSPDLLRPADCMQRRVSTAAAVWKRAPKTSAATTPSTR